MSQNKTEHKVFYEAPPSLPAPVNQSGIIAWIMNNLFKTPGDALLTLAFGAIMLLALVSFVNWTVNDANWWAVAFNFRQYMLGGYEANLEWRLGVVTLIAMFVAGMAVAIWIKQVARITLGVFIVVALALYALPPIILNNLEISPSYVAAGDGAIVVGNISEQSRSLMSFLGRAGETVTVRKTPIDNDEQLAQLSGFQDIPTNGMRVVAIGRADNIRNQTQITAELDQNASSPLPILTANQLEQRQAELGRIQIIPPITETLVLNNAMIQVELLDAQGQPLSAPIQLPTSNELASFTLPADGWYVLRTSSPDDENGVAILEVNGMYPLLQGSEQQRNEAGQLAFVERSTRMTDSWVVFGTSPTVDGTKPPFYDIVRNQYWGNRTLETYLRVYLAPFLQFHAVNTGLVMLAGLAGYFMTIGIERANKKLANQLATFALILLPVVIWLGIFGLSVAEILNLTIFFGAIFYIFVSAPIGEKFGMSPVGIGLWLVIGLMVMAIPYFTFNPNYGFGVLPVLNLIVLVPAGLAFNRGADDHKIQHEFKSSPENNRDFGLYLVLTLTFILIPFLLVQFGILNPNADYPDWFLYPSDQRVWGGLVITFVLTIFGIVVSFPIGALLAVGRRSNLPLIKYGCTLYIEAIRGSPFITVLFFGQLMIPLIHPSLGNVDPIIRALVAVIMFSAAYTAENVRGGLQALPKGQTEAAKALGLSDFQTMYHITLPQAIRAVIPALLGSFVSLFKDTSLVAIVGLTDISGFVNIQVSQAAFAGTRAEGLVFVTIIYFVLSYVMSYVSKLIEKSGSGVARRL
jgi:His/Glu/Gln/Arg/opine family amino acid ABC transporter permease subunit